MTSRIFTLFALLLTLAGSAQAGLMFTIDTFTTDEITFSISGSFDADTTGSNPGVFGIKDDWTNNQNNHTEWFDDNVAFISNSTIKLNGVLATALLGSGNSAPNDAFYILNPAGGGGGSDVITAGTEVTGSITISGINAFDPNGSYTFELLSGFNNSWVRLEHAVSYDGLASPVPEPSTYALLALGLVGLGVYRKRKK